MSDSIWAAFGTMPGRDGEISREACIERALTYLSDHDKRAFRKKFHSFNHDHRQYMEVFRELLVGAFMTRQGYTSRYAPRIDGLEPDWHFRRESESEFIADVRNFHLERKIEVQLVGRHARFPE